MWIKNTEGRRDSALTFSAIAFAVVLLKVLLGGTELTLLGWSLTVQPIGADVVAALLGCTMGTYAVRRYTDRKYSPVDPREDSSENLGDSGPEGGA
jgi:small neutral amino acid transporter SnatA (MarC family)